MTVKLIYAASQNGVIGKNGKVPWDLPEDLKHFQQLTKNNVVIMGRKTWESLPKDKRPLSNRLNIVISKTMTSLPGVTVERFLSDALIKSFEDDNNVTQFIIGGASLFKESIRYADEICLTNILHDFEGDTFAPIIPDDQWKVKSKDSAQILTSTNGLKYQFINYVRTSGKKLLNSSLSGRFVPDKLKKNYG